MALSLTPGGRRTRFKEHRGRVPFSAASESAPVGVSPRNRLYPGPASGIPRTTSLLSSQAWDLQPQILQGAGEELEEAGEGTPSTPPSASRARRGQAGSGPGSGVGESSGRSALPPLCRAPQFSPFGLSPSGPPHLQLGEENSPRSRAQSFLRDFPENPHELATIPLGGFLPISPAS